jgi:hypothetical protein
MTFDVVNVAQRSEEWMQLRAGRLTSTCADALLATGPGGKGESTQRKNLVAKLAIEQLTGKPSGRGFKRSAAMRYGEEAEPVSFAAYEAVSRETMVRTGFLQHRHLMAGTSLDGHKANFRGFCELKNPDPAQHLEYVLSGLVPLDYYRQCLHHFWMVPQAEWCDWMSHCEDIPAEYPARSKVVRIHRDGLAPIRMKKDEPPRSVADDIFDYDKKARALLEEVQALVLSIKTLGNLKATLQQAAGETVSA